MSASRYEAMLTREKVWKMRERLRKQALSQVDVGTVEVSVISQRFVNICGIPTQDFQGRENRVIIISCVRSRARFLDEDATKGLGLIYERKR